MKNQQTTLGKPDCLQSALNDLLSVLSDRDYKLNRNQKPGKDVQLWQKEIDGCHVNFWFYPKGDIMPCDMAEAEICFEGVIEGQWCKHTLYGLPPEKLAPIVPETEKFLLDIFTGITSGR